MEEIVIRLKGGRRAACVSLTTKKNYSSTTSDSIGEAESKALRGSHSDDSLYFFTHLNPPMPKTTTTIMRKQARGWSTARHKHTIVLQVVTQGRERSPSASSRNDATTMCLLTQLHSLTDLSPFYPCSLLLSYPLAHTVLVPPSGLTNPRLASLQTRWVVTFFLRFLHIAAPMRWMRISHPALSAPTNPVTCSAGCFRFQEWGGTLRF